MVKKCSKTKLYRIFHLKNKNMFNKTHSYKQFFNTFKFQIAFILFLDCHYNQRNYQIM